MARKADTRDTGITALVTCEYPRPTGRGRQAGIAVQRGKVAIHAGEAAETAEAFAAALRASYAARGPWSRGEPTGRDVTLSAPVRELAPWLDVAQYRPEWSDGLVDHRHYAGPYQYGQSRETGPTVRVRSRYIIAPYKAEHDAPFGGYCPECVPGEGPRFLPDDLYAPMPAPEPRKAEPAGQAPAPEPRKAPRAPRKPRKAEPARTAPEPAPHDPRDPSARLCRQCGYRYDVRPDGLCEQCHGSKAEPAPENVIPIVPAETAPERGYRPPACPRCGRADFRTPKGRAWHMTNNRECPRYVRPDAHVYRTAAAV